MVMNNILRYELNLQSIGITLSACMCTKEGLRQYVNLGNGFKSGMVKCMADKYKSLLKI